MKKAIILLLVLCLLLPGCTKTQKVTPSIPRQDRTVGIAVPDEGAWKQQAQALAAGFTELGYRTEVAYGENDPLVQEKQLVSFLQQGISVLVLVCVDAVALSQVCQQYKNAGVPIIAYDRMLTDTDWVKCYVACDYFAMGQALGNAVVNARDLANAEVAATVEFFMGSPEDHSALLLYQGIMDVLKPYLQDGTLVCKSGRVAFEDTCMVDWSAQSAGQALEGYLQEYYTDTPLDICCTALDAMAASCIQVLTDAGYTAEDFPTVTGQGATPEAIDNLQGGKQAVTVAVDAEALCRACVKITDMLLYPKEGESPAFTRSIHNHVTDVPSWLLEVSPVEG